MWSCLKSTCLLIQVNDVIFLHLCNWFSFLKGEGKSLHSSEDIIAKENELRRLVSSVLPGASRIAVLLLQPSPLKEHLRAATDRHSGCRQQVDEQMLCQGASQITGWQQRRSRGSGLLRGLFLSLPGRDQFTAWFLSALSYVYLCPSSLPWRHQNWRPLSILLPFPHFPSWSTFLSPQKAFFPFYHLPLNGFTSPVQTFFSFFILLPACKLFVLVCTC